MKSTIFEGIAERLTPQDINAGIGAFEQIRNAMVGRICPTDGHDIGLTGLCLNCGFKPRVYATPEGAGKRL